MSTAGATRLAKRATTPALLADEPAVQQTNVQTVQAITAAPTNAAPEPAIATPAAFTTLSVTEPVGQTDPPAVQPTAVTPVQSTAIDNAAAVESTTTDVSTRETPAETAHDPAPTEATTRSRRITRHQNKRRSADLDVTFTQDEQARMQLKLDRELKRHSTSRLHHRSR